MDINIGQTSVMNIGILRTVLDDYTPLQIRSIVQSLSYRRTSRADKATDKRVVNQGNPVQPATFRYAYQYKPFKSYGEVILQGLLILTNPDPSSPKVCSFLSTPSCENLQICILIQNQVGSITLNYWPFFNIPL